MMRRKRNSHAGTRGLEAIVDAMNKPTSRRNTILAPPRKEITPKKNVDSPNKSLNNCIVRVNKACVDGFFSSSSLMQLKEKLDAIISSCASDPQITEDRLMGLWSDFQAAVEAILGMDPPVRKRVFVEDELAYFLAKIDKTKDRVRLWGSELNAVTQVWKRIHESVEAILEKAKTLDAESESVCLRQLGAMLNQLHHGLLTDFGEFFSGVISDKAERTRVVFDCCFVVKKLMGAVDPAAKWKAKDAAVRNAMKRAEIAIKRKFDPSYEPEVVFVEEEVGRSESPRRMRMSFGDTESSARYMSERLPVGRKSLDDTSSLKRKLWGSMEKEQRQKNKPKRVQPKIELTPAKDEKAQDNWETASVVSTASQKSQKREEDLGELAAELKRMREEESSLSEQISEIRKQLAALKRKRSQVLQQKADVYDAEQEKVEDLKQEIELLRQDLIHLQKDEAAMIESQEEQSGSATIEREVTILDEACEMFTGTVQSMEDELDHLTNLNNLLKSGGKQRVTREHHSYSSSEEITPNPRRPVLKLKDDSSEEAQEPSDFGYLQDAFKMSEQKRHQSETEFRPWKPMEEEEDNHDSEEAKASGDEPGSDFSNEPNRHFSNGSQDLDGFDFNFTKEQKIQSTDSGEKEDEDKEKEEATHDDKDDRTQTKRDEKQQRSPEKEDILLGRDNARLQQDKTDLSAQLSDLSKQKMSLMREQMAAMRIELDGLPKDTSKVIRVTQLNTQLLNDQIIELESMRKFEEQQIQLFITTQPLRVRNSIAEANVGLQARLRETIDKKQVLQEKRTKMGAQWKEVDTKLNEIAKQKRRGPIKMLKLCDVSEPARAAFLNLEKSRALLKRTIEKIDVTMKEYNAAAAQARRKYEFLKDVAQRTSSEPDLLLLRMNIENARLAEEINKIETLSQSITRRYDIASQPKGLTRSLAALKRVIGLVINRARSK